MVESFYSGPSDGIQLRPVENPLDISYIAAIDYVCTICRKFVKKGRSHAHPSVKISKRQYYRR